MECYDNAISINPKYVDAYINKGAYLRIQGKNEDAIKVYDIAIGIFGTYYLGYYNKGLALFKMKRLKEALDCFDKSILYQNNHAPGYFNKGCVLVEMNKFEEAYAQLMKANQLSPNDQDILDELNYVSKKLLEKTIKKGTKTWINSKLKIVREYFKSMY